jgi:hypothetical protein
MGLGLTLSGLDESKKEACCNDKVTTWSSWTAGSHMVSSKKRQIDEIINQWYYALINSSCKEET